MKKLLKSIALIFFSQAVFGQSNSFEEHYRKNMPSLMYHYDEKRKIHDYSGNWDFDKDGKPDSVMFVGDDAVHTFYYIHIVLSKNRNSMNFQYLMIDFPLLGNKKEINRSSSLPKFSVYDFDGDGVEEIYLRIDKKEKTVNEELKKHKVYNCEVLLDFVSGQCEILDFTAFED